MLEELRHEKEASDLQAMRVTELEERNRELRAANRSLEDKITHLCEAPFISDAYGQQEARIRYEEMLREREEFRSKIDHLQVIDSSLYMRTPIYVVLYNYILMFYILMDIMIF